MLVSHAGCLLLLSINLDLDPWFTTVCSHFLPFPRQPQQDPMAVVSHESYPIVAAIDFGTHATGVFYKYRDGRSDARVYAQVCWFWLP